MDISDPVAIFDHLFRGGEAPGYPDKLCGRDLTVDPLTCEEYPPCE